MKLNRIYNLQVQVGPYTKPEKGNTKGASSSQPYVSFATKYVNIKLPFTLEFTVRRENLATAQTANFKIYNLAPKTRDQIYKEWFDGWKYSGIQLSAGYKDNFIPIIFTGTVRQAYTQRTGRTNMVTEIEAYDGGFAQANSYSNIAFSPGASMKEVITRLNSDLIGAYPTPVIGNIPTIINQRASVYTGPTFNLLQKISPVGTNITIDNNQLKVLGNNDGFLVNETIFNINSSTGLLDVPIREGVFIKCKMLFEPRLTIGQIVRLTSEDLPQYNGDYPVQGLVHEGIISDAVNGPCTTTVSLYLGPGGVKYITGGVTLPS